MKRKALILIALCTYGLLAWGAQPSSIETSPKYHYETSIPHGYDKIELQGDLATSVGPNAIEAGASDDAIYIGFNQSFGNVNISIYNALGGLVYSTVVNTNVQQVYIIPFAGVASGTYTVEINNADGSVEGDFEHN